MKRAVLFDLDGTLVESLPGIAQSLNAALKEIKHPPYSENQVRNFIGNGAHRLIKNALPGADSNTIQKTLTYFSEHYRQHWRQGTCLFPGISELLSDLKSDHWHLAILSNKPHEFVQKITQELFSPDLFDQVLGQRSGVPLKPNPESTLQIIRQFQISPAECFFVGDSIVDIETAKNANISSVLVTWGYQNLQNPVTANTLAQTPQKLKTILLSARRIS